MFVREAGIDDAPAIARVHVDSWRTTYAGIVPADFLSRLSYEQREDFWRRTLTDAAAAQVVLVAQSPDGDIVGFASGGPERSGDPLYRAELYAIYLLHEVQRRGIGRALTLAMARRLLDQGHRAMLLWVLAQNPARRFYEALGGKVLRVQEITIGGASFEEIAYGWDDLHALIAPPP
jgi:GNAT superfamily N-acetyltransferase